MTPLGPPPSKVGAMTVRLIATDLDGTLVRSDGTVSPRTRDALAAAEAAGIHVVFVTGRPLRWAEDVFDHVGSHGHAILSNGALVWDVANDALVEAHPIDLQHGLQVVQRLRAVVPEARFAAETLAGIRLETGFMAGRRLPEELPHGPVESLFAGTVVKVLAHHADLDIQIFWDRATTAIGSTLEITWSSSTALLEMSARGVTKGSALASFSATHGIDAAEVVAIGDMPNDLGMLSWAGRSYAMANADPRVIAATDQTTASNDEDGVAQVIEQILAEGEQS